MDEESRCRLRRVRESSIVGPTPIDWGGPAASGVMVQAESKDFPVRALHGQLISLHVSEMGCRVRHFERYSGIAEPREWSISATPSVVRREVRRLERLGLWELSDSEARLGDDVMADGDYWVVRAMDFDRKIYSDACLSYPDSSAFPHIRRIHRCLNRLVNLKRQHFLRQSRWGRLF